MFLTCSGGSHNEKSRSTDMPCAGTNTTRPETQGTANCIKRRKNMHLTIYKSK